MNEMIANWRVRGREKGKRSALFLGCFGDGKPDFGNCNIIYAAIFWGKTYAEAQEVLEELRKRCEKFELAIELELERCS